MRQSHTLSHSDDSLSSRTSGFPRDLEVNLVTLIAPCSGKGLAYEASPGPPVLGFKLGSHLHRTDTLFWRPEPELDPDTSVSLRLGCAGRRFSSCVLGLALLASLSTDLSPMRRIVLR